MTVIQASGNGLRPVGARFALATALMVLIGLCHLLPAPLVPDHAGTTAPGTANGTPVAPARNHGTPASEAPHPIGPGSAARKAGGGGSRGLTLPGVLRGR